MSAPETNRVYLGDCRDVMRQLIASGVRVQMVCTSPPYWGLRDYGVAGQLGLEQDYREYVANMVEVFGLARELLAEDGTLWLNLGDSYAANRGYQVPSTKGGSKHSDSQAAGGKGSAVPDGLKPKDLCGIPWRVAFALQESGWWLRSDIIWHKTACMPESVTDRPTKSHEHVFLLTKSERYFYNAAEAKEDVSWDTDARYARGRSDHHKYADGVPGGQTIARTFDHMKSSGNKERKPASARGVPVGPNGKPSGNLAGSIPWEGSTRNWRDVWTLGPEPYPDAHFAVMPTGLAERCIVAGSRPGDVVFDPFMGSGTVAAVAQRLGRRWLGAELNPEYIRLIEARTKETIGFEF